MRNIKVIAVVLLLSILFYSCKNNSVIPPGSNSNITLVATYGTNASTTGIFVLPINFRNYAFIADGTNGMQIIDVTQINLPDSVSSFNTDGSANDVFIANINNNYYAFISDYNSGYVIVNVSNPFNPTLVSDINFSGDFINTSFVDVINKIAYVGFAGGQVNIYDISPLPSQPVFLNTIPAGGNTNGMFLAGNNLYLAQGNIGFEIYDVSNPLNPGLKSVYNTPGLASDVIVNTNYAYVADSYNGMLIFNVTNTSAPVLLSRFQANGQILGLTINNNSVYTADNTYGVETVNVSNPAMPSQIGYLNSNSSAVNIFYFGGYLFLAAAEGGLAILQPTN